jgi:hypothetical protein
VTGRSYTPSASQASGVDQIAEWIGKHPDRTGVFGFLAAKLVQRHGLDYFATFNRLLGAAMNAGLSEAFARRELYRGFAFAAAGHVEPPADLEEGGG